MANGVSFGDKVLILCETRVEWFLCAQAVAKLGGCVVTLFSNLGKNLCIFSNIISNLKKKIYEYTEENNSSINQSFIYFPKTCSPLMANSVTFSITPVIN